MKEQSSVLGLRRPGERGVSVLMGPGPSGPGAASGGGCMASGEHCPPVRGRRSSFTIKRLLRVTAAPHGPVSAALSESRRAHVWVAGLQGPQHRGRASTGSWVPATAVHHQGRPSRAALLSSCLERGLGWSWKAALLREVVFLIATLQLGQHVSKCGFPKVLWFLS